MSEHQPQMNAEGWREEYIQALDRVVADPQVDLGKVAIVVLEKGIIPKSASEKDIDTNDLELYERLYYAVEGSRWAANQTADFFWTNQYAKALYKISANDEVRVKLFGSNDPVTMLLDEIQRKIIEKYNSMGGNLNLKPIIIGTKGSYHGIDITISGYCPPDGKLRIDADTEEGHRDLYQYTKGGGLNPGEFHSDNFIRK